MPSVNRFARNGGRSLGSINPQFRTQQTTRYPQNTAPTKPRNSSRNRKPSEMPCSADIASQVTFRRLSAVDRYIIAVRRCYRSIRGLRNFALARATKGLCPLESRSLEKAGELFSFWCGSVAAVPLNIKSKMNRIKAVRFTNKTQSPLCADT